MYIYGEVEDCSSRVQLKEPINVLNSCVAHQHNLMRQNGGYIATKISTYRFGINIL